MQGKRTSRILQAVGEVARPEVPVQLRKKLVADADSLYLLEGDTKRPWRVGRGGLPESLSWRCIQGGNSGIQGSSRRL